MNKISPKAKINKKLLEVPYMSDDKMNSRDCLQRAWINTMELVKDFEMYSKRIDNEEVSMLFKKYAEEQGITSSNIMDMYNKYK